MRSISIYDFSGKLVKQIETATTEMIIDMNALAKGFYNLVVIINDHSKKNKDCKGVN